MVGGINKQPKFGEYDRQNYELVADPQMAGQVGLIVTPTEGTTQASAYQGLLEKARILQERNIPVSANLMRDGYMIDKSRRKRTGEKLQLPLDTLQATDLRSDGGLLFDLSAEGAPATFARVMGFHAKVIEKTLQITEPKTTLFRLV